MIEAVVIGKKHDVALDLRETDIALHGHARRAGLMDDRHRRGCHASHKCPGCCKERGIGAVDYQETIGSPRLSNQQREGQSQRVRPIARNDDYGVTQRHFSTLKLHLWALEACKRSFTTHSTIAATIRP